MPWGLYTLGLLLTFILQTTVLRYVGLPSLDLLLALALVCGLAATAQEARLAAWLTGFVQDIGSDVPLGLHALVLGLMVFALTYLRGLVNLHVWWARWVIALVVAIPAQLLLRAGERFAGYHLSWSQIVSESLPTAILAALLAAAVIGLPAVLGKRRRHYSARW